MKSGVTKKEYRKLVKKMKGQEYWSEVDFAKVVGYCNNKPWQEIYEKIEEARISGELVPSHYIIGSIH